MDQQVAQRLTDIKEDLKIFDGTLGSSIDAVHVQDVSNYPILIAHHEDTIALGLPILKRSEAASHFDYALTTLEELVGKNVVAQEKVEDFIEKYKAAGRSYCVLVMIGEAATFAFQPRKL